MQTHHSKIFGQLNLKYTSQPYKNKISQISKAISMVVMATAILSGCNSGGGMNAASAVGSSTATAAGTNSASKVFAPVIKLSNSSSNAAGCSYFLIDAANVPHGQTGIAGGGATPATGNGSYLPVGQSWTWNWLDVDQYETQYNHPTAVCGYNTGCGLNGQGSQQGNIFLAHNRVNNTLILTATGLPTSKATLTCLNAQGIQTTTVMTNDFLTDYTCTLDGTAASTISLNFGGDSGF